MGGVLVRAHHGEALVGGRNSAARRDARAARDGSERMCIVTRERRAPEELIRFVLGPDGTVVPDIRAKLPGRGVWVTARAELVREAVGRQAFSRGLKASAKADKDLAAETDALIERDCLQSLSLANKAGTVVTGFTRVEAAIESGHVALLLHAKDASAEEPPSSRRRCEGSSVRHSAAGRSFRLGPIGFGTRAGKCGTRSAQSGAGEQSLSRPVPPACRVSRQRRGGRSGADPRDA